MKRLLFYAIICIPLLTSCTKEKVLSCNPEINAWAHKNLSKYENAERYEIVSLPILEQTAIYVGLSGQKKVELWHDKLDLVILDNILTTNQLIHYKKLIDYVKPEHFDTEEGKNSFNSFAQSWQTEMKEKYDCSDEMIFWIAQTWMTQKEFESSYLQTMTKFDAKDDIVNTKRTCNCIYSLYCMIGALGGTCNSGNCDQSEGCGILGNSNCNGYCE